MSSFKAANNGRAAKARRKAGAAQRLSAARASKGANVRRLRGGRPPAVRRLRVPPSQGRGVVGVGARGPRGAADVEPRLAIDAVSKMKGPQGAPGATGAAGATGAQGATGDAGDQGATGVAGADGATDGQGTKGDVGGPRRPGGGGAGGWAPATIKLGRDPPPGFARDKAARANVRLLARARVGRWGPGGGRPDAVDPVRRAGGGVPSRRVLAVSGQTQGRRGARPAPSGLWACAAVPHAAARARAALPYTISQS
jgi:hypothetical protein